ncbi:MAG: glycosyltransferase [Methanoregula sp.]|uniref:glycosyltransferase n=1 Tax=Methanoregula sp. TaxID=2052170 RepID=UPI0025FD5A2E|nr:glycosyltransferase [Methanoregula sp.]MCK9631149.1 glycosyltransferase [Methanoregula sp.]
MKILLISTQDYIHHPIPSRHHYIFEDLAQRHEVHVAHFHVSRENTRPTGLIVEEATQFPLRSPLLHYTFNTPYHYYIFDKIVREGNYDAIVAAHVLAGTAVIRAAKKYNVPVVFDLKDWFPDSAAAYFKNRFLQEAVRKSVWAITRYNLSNSDKITTVSPSLVEKLARFGFTAELITNGVDTDIFKPLDGSVVRKELGIGTDDFVIGFSGSVERWYAIDDMIRALPALIEHRQKTRLLIVGGSLFTNYQQELASLASDLNVSDHVIFTGTKPYHELPRYIACMDACTIPLSPPQWGNIALPNKFFEYSACGKPIIMRPMPDVERTGAPHLRVYRTQDEYIGYIKEIMEQPVTYTLNLEKNSWKEKSRQFEAVLHNVI